MQEVGRRLAAIRRSRMMSQTALAKAVGKSVKAIAHYEHGRADLRPAILNELARALHCRADDFLAPAEAPLPRVRFRGGAALIDPVSGLSW